MTPNIQALLSRPCRSCGGTEFSYVPMLDFVSAGTGNAFGYAYRHTVVACRQCRLTDLFADISTLEGHKDHAIVRVPGAPPAR